jgi:hypothetical protein
MGDTTKRTEQVHVRMSAAERDELLRLASQLDITPSELIRRSVAPYGSDLLNRRRRRAQEVASCLS